MIRTAVIFCLLLTGCSTFRRTPGITAGGVTVQAPADPGKPATLATTQAGESLPLPAGSTVRRTETAAVPAQPATATAAAQPFRPAVVFTEVTVPSPTVWERTEATVTADTGTTDTTVAVARLEAEERRWLLWAAIGCGVAGLIVRSMLPAWPSLSNGLLLGAVLAGAAWKVAALPAWIWLAGLLVAGLLVAGYKRAEWDANKDGIPDVLQK